jgi:hypothetical protein
MKFLHNGGYDTRASSYLDALRYWYMAARNDERLPVPDGSALIEAVTNQLVLTCGFEDTPHLREHTPEGAAMILFKFLKVKGLVTDVTDEPCKTCELMVAFSGSLRVSSDDVTFVCVDGNSRFVEITGGDWVNLPYGDKPRYVLKSLADAMNATNDTTIDELDITIEDETCLS